MAKAVSFWATVILFVNLFCRLNISLAGQLPEWASGYPRNSGNPSQVMVGVNQGTFAYLDISSVTVDVYDPPYYQITGMIRLVKNDNVVTEFYCRWKYVWSEYVYDRKMYELLKDTWQYIPMRDMPHAFLMSRVGGEIAWWSCYGMDFYGDPLK